MLQRLQGVFASLSSHDVEYLVIGGIAVVLYGVPRATFDLDILIRPDRENAERLLKALLAAGLATAELTTADEILANEITIFKDRVRIDVQTSTPGLTFETAWQRRRRMEYHGASFFLVSREDLITSKQAAGRPVDLQDVQMLQVPEGQGEG
jgi:hypothetical protein